MYRYFLLIPESDLKRELDGNVYASISVGYHVGTRQFHRDGEQRLVRFQPHGYIRDGVAFVPFLALGDAIAPTSGLPTDVYVRHEPDISPPERARIEAPLDATAPREIVRYGVKRVVTSADRVRYIDLCEGRTQTGVTLWDRVSLPSAMIHPILFTTDILARQFMEVAEKESHPLPEGSTAVYSTFPVVLRI